MPIDQTAFGTTPDGSVIDRYTLVNANGCEVDILTYGATLMALRVPDRNGVVADVLLGFDTLEGYSGPHPYFGALIGRYANRIAGGQFTLDGQTYTLARNNGPNHLHGGPNGFHRVVWQAQPRDTDAGPAVELRYLSRDGEEGYPGNLSVTVVYTLTDRDELRLDYTATTDRATVLNLTNHAYFNLAGSGDILGHELELPGTHFVPTDATNIPLGALAPVAGTPMDFTTPTLIGSRIDADDEQIRCGLGYDHTWVRDTPADERSFVVRVFEPTSGRIMEVFTSEPGVQFYSGNQLDGSVIGKGGQAYGQRAGLCLETQHFPDSPNQPQFPSTMLNPGATYQQTTIYRFSVRQ